MKIKRETITKIIVAAGTASVILFLLWFMFSGDNRELLISILKNDYKGEELRDKLNDFGVRGYITIIISTMLQVVSTFLPAEPVQVLAGLTFGFAVGVLCCAVGVLLGNTLIYLLQRLFGDKLRRFFTQNIGLDMEHIAKSSKITAIVFILYFLPVIPYGMICFFAAGTGMKYRRFALITLLGSLPSICIGVGLGYITVAYSWILAVVLFGIMAVVLLCLYCNRKKLFSKLNTFASSSKNLSKTTVQKANGFLLALLYNVLLCYYYMCGFRIRSVNKYGKQPEKPSIILCNHGSFIDFVYAETVLRKNHPHFVVARLYFYHRFLGWLLRKMGCFPKSMFTMDMECTKNCLRVLKNGEILAMMPEARLSTVGRFEDIQETTYSFLKKSRVPVYTVKIEGDYFADPKWGKGMRRGALVEVEFDILFTAEELAKLSIAEIKAGVEERLYYDEFRWLQSRPNVRYRNRNLAEGLENVLTLCPECGQKYTVYTKGRDVLCKNCGKLTSLDDRYGFTEDFRFRNFALWYHWQKDVLQQQILTDESFSLQSRVELRLPGNGRGLTRHGGDGLCILDRSGLRYVGTKDNEDIDVHFPIKQVYRLLFGAGENFEIYNGEEIFYFVPEIKQSSVDWYMTSMILYDEMKSGE